VSVIHNATRLKNKRHGTIAAAREVCNTGRQLGDGSRLMLRQRVQGSVRAVRAVQNTDVFQTDTRLVADERDLQFQHNEVIDIGNSQTLRQEGIARINKLSAMRPGVANLIENVCIL